MIKVALLQKCYGGTFYRGWNVSRYDGRWRAQLLMCIIIKDNSDKYVK